MRRRLPTGSLIALASSITFGTMVCSHRPEVGSPAGPGVLPAAPASAEELRLVPAEAYIRTYLSIFGGLAPLEVQAKARGADGPLLFDAWGDYLTALGLPDHRADAPRGTQTNALMLAAFERLGAALCARALEHDWRGPVPVPVDRRLVFAFEPSEGPLDRARFTAGLDVLHRTFLGHPVRLAKPERITRYHGLFEETRAHHAAGRAPRSRVSPAEAGWLSVCEGLARHPELHLY